MARRTLALLAMLLSACGDDAPPAGPAESFIAVGRDFRGFWEWPIRIEASGSALPIGVEPGPTYVYARQPPPTDAMRFPVGTILVKSVENDPRTSWAVHAMVKRDGSFNAAGGSVGWEYFEIVLSAGDEPVIVWRGEGPPSGLGYALSPGMDAGVVELVCNDCHAGAWMSDSVLTPELAPSAP